MPLWAPRRTDPLEPQSELDSQLRDFLCRIVERAGTVTISLDDDARVPGRICWEFAATPVGAREVTLWFVPDE